MSFIFYYIHQVFLLSCRAFDVNKKFALAFNDFLSGLAAMEPCTQHGGVPAEQRCRYIFRYYDRNGDSQLQVDEFRFVMLSTKLL